jgi:hypothetical protein
MRSLVVLICAFGLEFGLSVGAATPYKRSLTVKHGNYLSDGVFTGGHAGTGSSLLSVRRAYSPKAQLERVIVDMGDKDAQPAGKDMGYFQASMDSHNRRIVLDISQLRYSKVSEQQVQNIFRKSPYVASVAFTLDPEDKAATMVLNLKRPMKLEVFQLLKNKKPARIVMDLTPQAAPRARVKRKATRAL